MGEDRTDRPRWWRRRSAARRRPHQDLRIPPLPAVSREDWADPEAVLVVLYRLAEQKTLDAVDWYLQERQPKKRASLTLRAAAIVLASLGGLQPLLALAHTGVNWAAWGYLLFGAAAACIAFDQFFGLSSTWMRCMVAAQRLQARLEEFQYAWSAAYATGPAPLADRLALLRAFSQDVRDIVLADTTEWEREFQSRLNGLESQAALSGRDPIPLPRG